MTAQAAALTRSWRVGSRIVTLTIPRTASGTVAAACMEWWPNVPERLSVTEYSQYRAGRNAALMELADVAGIRIAVMDV